MTGAARGSALDGMGRTAALRPQVADADRYRRIGVHGLAEPVERQRLDMEFDIGGGVVGRGLGEHAELRRRHGHRPAPAKAIVEPHHRPLDPRLIVDIERARAGDAEDRSQLQMVLQIFADPRQRMDDRRRRSPARRSGAPTPESSKSCGEPIAPAASMTSRPARASRLTP